MIRTKSAEETQKFGALLAERLEAGDVLLLRGPLGAGKSELTRGLARGLGVTETVTSPSFTILNVYETGRIPLYHFDWYRLDSAEELFELGMQEYLGGEGIAVVEWPEKGEEALPETFLEIRILPEESGTRRLTAIRHGRFRSLKLEGFEEA